MSVTIIHGDCRAVLPTLADGSVQCVVSSPPYFGLRDYGHADQIGAETTPAAYVSAMVDVFRGVRRVLRDDGTVWLNLGDSYANDTKWGGSSGGKHAAGLHGDTGIGRGKKVTGLKGKDLVMIPARVAIALCDDGWYLRSDVIWHKPNPMPESVTDRPTSAHEHVFLLTKSASYFYDADAIREEGVIAAGTLGAKGSATRAAQPGVNSRPPEYKIYDGTRNVRNVWSIATQPYSGAHFATMAPDLAERCIKAGTSERGSCPDCGTPWVRITERTTDNRSNAAKAGTAISGKGHVSSQVRSGHDIRNGPVAIVSTTGWAQSCSCPAHQPVPQVVLDPFGGAGTTGLVADRLGRNAVLIELNPAYGALARARIANDAPLFAEVS